MTPGDGWCEGELPGTLTRRDTLTGLTAASLAMAGAPASAHFGSHDSGDNDVTIGLDLVASGFDSPVGYHQAPEDRDRAFVPDQPGVIHVVEDGIRPEPFLDIEDRVYTGGNEAGLLGLAFHPDFAENRQFYVRYSAPRREGTPENYSHTFVLSEFQATEDFARADTDSERAILEIPEPQGNHNAADVEFGPDGYLYVPVGDGGAANDQGTGHVEDWYDDVGGGNGQDVTENLLGSILRIDVDSQDGDKHYAIPDTNPLVGEEGLDEHYAWGLRNPWQISFDPQTGRLFTGDVGQNRWEEVNIVEKGGNYGWNVREGRHCFQTESCQMETPDGEDLIDPIVEYAHPSIAAEGEISGVSVAGGYVYRGSAIPKLQGAYVFGDLTGTFMIARESGDGTWSLGHLPLREEDTTKLPNLIAFGSDRSGELYATTRGHESGAVYRIVADDSAQTTTVAVDDTPPATGDGSDPGQQAPSTATEGVGLGIATALAGLASGVGLARWLRE
jgi:glucose/arabinose dehydrogenase